MTTVRNSLQLKEPFHLPGYAGTVPQLQFKCGQRHSKLTHDLFLDPTVAKSGQLVLSRYDPQVKNYEQELLECKKFALKHRTSSLGDQKLLYPLVPGYTGAIPKSINYFGQTYARTSLDAIHDFETSKNAYLKKWDEIQALDHTVSGADNSEKAVKLPLEAIKRDAAPYISKNRFKLEKSVYRMDRNNKNKRMITGYMGFVPRTRDIFGKDYEKMTHTGINTFTDELRMNKQIAKTPVTIIREESKRTDPVNLYPQNSGLISKYTGHVPGLRYKFGETYWNSTFNARNKLSDQYLRKGKIPTRAV